MKLVIGADALARASILQSIIPTEWSGYGPLIKVSDDTYLMPTFYFVSMNDSLGSTELDPLAAAEAWQMAADDGFDVSQISLAWVHCHPHGMADWSLTDDKAVMDCLEYQARDDAMQVSVLFAGNKVVARYDDLDITADMDVELDWGPWTAVARRAAEAASTEVRYYGDEASFSWLD